MKNYVGMSRDHSSSMQGIAKAAMADYNGTVNAIKAGAVANNQDTILSTVRFANRVQRELVNSNVQVFQPITSYPANGMTALWDSIWELMDIMESVPDADDPNVSFLILATTDGEENNSDHTIDQLLARMYEKTRTDRWTFVFRVPRGAARRLIQLGIPEGNVLEWDTTSRGMAVAQQQSEQAFTQYFNDRSTGMKSTTKFYANLADVSIKDIQQYAANGDLTDISSEVKYFPVSNIEAGTAIRDFVEQKTGAPLLKGAAFYQLVKTEPKVQANKRIAIRNKTTGAVYAGDAARQMLALPLIGTVRLAPDELGDFEVFIQSTSVNRKVDGGTKLMYWDQVGKAFKEGPSAR